MAMLSRVAENIYWLVRYIERAENTARVIKVNTQLVLDTPKGITPGWEPLVSITGMNREYTDCCEDHTERNVVRFLIDHEANPNSIVACLKQAKENCRTVREVLPRSAWELINELMLYASAEARVGISKKGRETYLNKIIGGSQRLTGLLASVLYRDEGFHFASIGRNLERSDMTTRIVDVMSTDLFDEEAEEMIETQTLESLQGISILKSMSGYQSYRRQVQIRVRRSAVLEYLLKDMRFPRSVLHCLNSVEESVATFPNSKKSLASIRKTARLTSNLNVNKISKPDLHKAVDEFQLGIIHIHSSLKESYFS